jgi:hypothetical protein
MATARIGGIEIPAVYAVDIGHEVLGDKARTAGGKLRLDFVRVIHTWKLQTRPITKASRDALINFLDSIAWGACEFWLDEFGDPSNTRIAYVTVDSDERVQFWKDGVWQRDGRQMTLTIEEE